VLTDREVCLAYVGQHNRTTEWRGILARNMKAGRGETVWVSAVPTVKFFCVSGCEPCLENRKIEIEGVMACTGQGGVEGYAKKTKQKKNVPLLNKSSVSATVTIRHGSPTHSPPVCIIPPAATFVYCVRIL
jgi:hypothetical protein